MLALYKLKMAIEGVHREACCRLWLVQSFLLCTVTSLSATLPWCDASPEAKRLYDDKLKRGDYNKLIRPVGNTTDTLVVKIGLRLTQIIDVVSLWNYVRLGQDIKFTGGRRPIGLIQNVNVNVNVRHIYWAPPNSVTEALHAVELTSFVWHMPEGVAEPQLLDCSHQSTCMPSYSLYVQLLSYPNVLPRRDEGSGKPCTVNEAL